MPQAGPIVWPPGSSPIEAFDELWIWDDAATRQRLGWYLDVARNRKPAKFRIARSIAAGVSLEDADEAALWAELDRLTPVFVERWQGLRDADSVSPDDLPGLQPGPQPGAPTLLDICAELAARMLTHCNFCRWECDVDRSLGAKFGTCKLAGDSRVSTYFHHQGEELVYRGRRGSGTIFFTSCNMRCAFCQNGDISTDKDNGMVTDARTLAVMAWLLRMEGCHNINWVGGDPTIHLHTITKAIQLLGGELEFPAEEDLRRAVRVKGDPLMVRNLRPEGATFAGRFNAPMLWNSNFFMSPEAMKILRLLIDVWLPDFKFGPGRCALRLAKTSWYWETVTTNLARIEGWEEDLTIRHLVMPNHVECCTFPVLDWIAENMPDVPVNVMDQYHPDTFTDPCGARYEDKYEELSRRPTPGEIQAAYRYARQRGVRFEAVTWEKNVLGLSI